MAPPSGLHQSAIPSDFDTPFPALVRRPSSSSPSTVPPSSLRSHRADPSHLSPEDAYTSVSPPRPSVAFDAHAHAHAHARPNGSGTDSRPHHRIRHKDPGRPRSGRRRKRFQKLLWVKQSYPDNYTDQATFLENLQRNPRVRPYDFWPLVADSTVIVQHVCSVIIFVVCFVGIFQERVSPVSVVGWGSFATFLGWLLWDWWVTQETQGAAASDSDASRARIMRGERACREYRPPHRQDSSGPAQQPSSHNNNSNNNISTASISSTSNLPSAASSTSNLLQEHHPQRVPPPDINIDNGSSSSNSNSNSNNTSNNGTRGGEGGGGKKERGRGESSNSLPIPNHAHSRSVSSVNSVASQASANSPASTATRPCPEGCGGCGGAGPERRTTAPGARGGRAYARVSTIKSAILIYFTLLGLSPILKSLTRSTSSDSIWAMSFWLLAINVFFFDYSGSSWVGIGRHKKMPVASLSTNAALMASTVLASRLPSTGQVFSLTLFSIEVFGLFPVFRQHARHRSWRYHVALTVLLVLGAGAGVGMVLGQNDAPPAPAPADHHHHHHHHHNHPSAPSCTWAWAWPWRRALVGMLVGCLIAALAMGGCSWWLISLQKYKNEIYGPWDPARPIIISRRYWDDE